MEEIKDSVKLVVSKGDYESLYLAVQQANPDIVYHLAAYYTGAHGPEDAQKLLTSNIVLGAYLLEAMSACNCNKIVCASSVMAYCNGESYSPLNLYAATKQAFCDLLSFYENEGLIHGVTLILSDTYGPGDRRPKILNLIRNAISSGEKIALSDGGQDYDLTYIDDVVRAFCLAGKDLLAEKYSNASFQVAPKNPRTLRQTVELMLNLNGLTADLSWGKRPAAGREIRRAIRIYPSLPGWEPLVALEEGLVKYIQQA